MDSSQSTQPGLPPHLMQQLQQASQHVSQINQAQSQVNSRGEQRGGPHRSGTHRGMNRGLANNARYSQTSYQTNAPHPSQDPRLYPQSVYPQNNLPPQAFQNLSARVNQVNYQQNMAAPHAGNEDDFPALGSAKSSRSSRSSSIAPSQPPRPQGMNHDRAQDFQQRARDGFYRGRNSISHQNTQGRPQQQRFAQQPQYHMQQFQVDDFRRPPPQQQGVYNPMAASVANQRHALRKRFALQSEYLETVAETALQNQMPVAEQQEKEAMRQTLETIMHNVIDDYGKTQSTIDAAKVKLKCYGSLASGFAVAGSDMDLLVTFPRDGEPTGNLEEDIKRLFEKALLKAGFGARLLTQTRVPIMRVCETPTPEILDGLRRYRAKWEQDEQDVSELKDGNFDPNRLPIVTREQIEAMSDTFAELSHEPSDIPLPPSPGRELPHLEYTKDCGIQCDINFSNYVALHNTRLLRTYCLHDERVRRMGLIIKAWAKARKINTPYHGTLSSYGYILMLLHFLMNVASPPVIPNLQTMAKDQDAWNNRTDFETVDGFDVRFVSDREQIAAAIEGRPRNQETLGGLLRGFFWYYSDQQGFHWTNDIISIRTPGGSLTKRSKGWTEAKWAGAKNTVRNRYLLCIEDPFETEHNIARTVCHSGIVAIRDEFRRARKILERVEKVPNVGWQWFEDNREPGQDFMAVTEDRGDLLRKDYDFHKLKRLRAEAEATEKALKEANALVDLEEGGADDGSKQDGRSSQHCSRSDVPLEAEPPGHKLTQSVGHQQDNRLSQQRRLRQLKFDSDDEADEEIDTDQQKLNVMSKHISENTGLPTSVPTSSSESEKQDASEPYCFYGSASYPRAVDTFGKLLPWDVGTQEGRWLQWRDGKVRNGVFTGILSPGLRSLNEQCPFDPSRPPAVSLTYPTNLNLIKPPFPMSKPFDEQDLITDEHSCVEDEIAIEALNEVIGWDLAISDCRWLNKRDELMRAGTFVRPSDPHVRNLDKEFPFLEQTPPNEQRRRNKVLRDRHTQWFKGEISQLEKDTLQVSTPTTRDEPLVEQSNDVGWDISLADGRWLRNRDELVRTGQFRRAQYQLRALQLHDEFPYIANTTTARQNKRNLQLKLWGIARLMAEIPEDVHHALDIEMDQDSDNVHQLPVEAVPHGIERLETKGSSIINKDSVTPAIEVTRSKENEAQSDFSNPSGKWLKERDVATRAGMWTPGELSTWQDDTDTKFPFLPEFTREEQDKRNEVLKYEASRGGPPDLILIAPEVVRKNGVRDRKCSPEQLVSFSENEEDLVPKMTDQPWMKIQWERSTRYGKWLRWRDKQIKQGTWKGVTSRQFQRLDAMFPYIENPSLEEQADRNAQLLAMCDDQKLSRLNTSAATLPSATEEKPMKSHHDFEAKVGPSTNSQCPEVQEGSDSNQKAMLWKMTWENSLLGSWFSWRDNKIRNGTWTDRKTQKFLTWLDVTLPYVSQPTPNQQRNMNEQLKAITADHPQLKDFEGLQNTQDGRPSAKDMIRLLSLGEHRSIPQSRVARNAGLEPLSNKPIPYQSDGAASQKDFVRHQPLGYSTSPYTATQDTKPENQNPTNVQGLPGKADMSLEPPSNVTNMTTATTTGLSTSAFLRNNSGKTEIAVNARGLVPQTLHKGSIDDCPRDEDPAVMPIPSTPAFSFDQRQLRDMNIIKQGGNGCARFGEEWNIEADGEWGGGGWMGHKSSSKQEPEAEDAGEDEKWEDKGDEEGLLDELPRLY